MLRIAYAGDPSSLVPFLAIDQEIIALDTLFCQTLVGLDADNRDVPILVTRIPSRANGDVSSDGTRITYHLRRGVKFADGVELTSRDVAFTYRAVLDPQNRATSVHNYERIASLATPDPYTVVITLRHSWNAAVHVLFAEADYMYGILPAHAFSGTKVVGSRWENAPFGTGPFRVAKWTRGDSILLEPNPYFRPRPKLSRIVLQIVPNLNTNFIVLQSGAVDIGTLTPENVERAATLPGVDVVRVPENATDLFYMQTQTAPTNDVHVRRAIAYALDLNALQDAWRHQYPPAGSFLPPPIVRWKSVTIPPYPHDPARAGRELDAAGWALKHGLRVKNGGPLAGVMGVNAEDPTQMRIATLVQSELAAVGMRVTLKPQPTSLWFSPQGLLRNGDATFVSEPWVGGSDPEQSVNLTCEQAVKGDSNHAFFCSKALDALFADQATTPSQAQRNRDFDAMQVLVRRDVPAIPLYYEYRLLGVNRRVTGYATNMLWVPVNAELWDAH
ncbi:MAG TPA: ABC transporter substrate-binding protein [Candidatus Acidoferrales bacterium]|nr:ABC transporter substrate-binding protein [Candidatus Acidoferrales bacterium]